MMNTASITLLILAGAAVTGAIILFVMYREIAQSWAEALGMKRKK